jgi:excisionase family DNA binding protein
MPVQTKAIGSVEKLLYRPKEAATAIGASPSWVYARIEDGSLKCVRLAGRMVRIRHEDLLEFIEAGRRA